jgi:hypothetical protein
LGSSIITALCSDGFCQKLNESPLFRSEQHGKCTTWVVVVDACMSVYLQRHRQPNRPGEDLGAMHAAPCTHYHARDGEEQEHASTHSLEYFGLAHREKKQLSLFSLLNIDTFSLHHFFIPSKHFLPSVESCACYLVVSILDQLFLEILAWTSNSTSPLQIKPQLDQSELPPDRDP